MSLLVTRHEFTVVTLKPNNNPHTGRLLLRLAPRKHDRSASEWKQCCLFFILSVEALCIKNSLLKIRQLIQNFIWWFWDVCGMGYKESDLKCKLWEVGSFITIMHLLTQCCQLDNSWQNIQFLPFHNPSYSPNLSSPDFFKFPKLKITLKGSIFQTVKDIITNATNDLKAIPQTYSKQCFQKW
jgi:hypothetical protein